jgi:hypothetical protein
LAHRRKLFPQPSPSALVGARADVLRGFASLGLLCLLGTCVACTSGQIGGEVIYSNPVDESFAACEVVSQVPVAADEPGLAFDLDATMAAVHGTRAVETLSWGETLPKSMSITPQAGRGTIQLEIEVIQNSAFELHRRAVVGMETAEASVCSPLLAFDAKVTVVTENTALAGTFAAIFVAQSPHLVTAAFEVVPGAERAMFEVDAGESAIGTARFELAWADGRLSGSLSGSLTSGETTSNFELARFPSDGCLDGNDLSPESALVGEAEALVSGLDHFELGWPNGTTTELELTPDFDLACLRSTTPLTVVLPIAYSAETADGGIDGSWDALAVVTFDDEGHAISTEVSRADVAVSLPGEFAADTGITGIAVDDEWPATFRLQLNDQVDDQPATGTLTVFESHPAVCESAPDGPTSDGGVTPGCSGEELIELGSASLVLAD